MNDLTREWIEKAEGDFATAQRELRARRQPNFDAACFHAQQCAEKYLKALLMEHGATFPKTHNLVDLLDLALRHDSALGPWRDSLLMVTPYGVRYRYPGESANRLEALAAVRAIAPSDVGLSRPAEAEAAPRARPAASAAILTGACLAGAASTASAAGLGRVVATSCGGWGSGSQQLSGGFVSGLLLNGLAALVVIVVAWACLKAPVRDGFKYVFLVALFGLWIWIVPVQLLRYTELGANLLAMASGARGAAVDLALDELRASTCPMPTLAFLGWVGGSLVGWLFALAATLSGRDQQRRGTEALDETGPAAPAPQGGA